MRRRRRREHRVDAKGRYSVDVRTVVTKQGNVFSISEH